MHGEEDGVGYFGGKIREEAPSAVMNHILTKTLY